MNIDEGDLMSAEEFFGTKSHPSSVCSVRRPKKPAKDDFNDVMVRMMMKIYHVSRKEAIAMIAKRAEERKALARKEKEAHEDLLSDTAEEFFSGRV